MSTTLTPAPVVETAMAPTTYRPATYRDVVRSEWTKFRTVKATFWCLTVGVILGVGVGALISALTANRYHTDLGVHAGWNATDHSLRSLGIAQFAFAVLGVMAVTGEYSTGMIRPSLAAVPRRLRMMSAKLGVLTVATLVTGQILAFTTFAVGQALIAAAPGHVPSASLGDHEVLRAVIGSGLYLSLLALLGAGLAVLARHAAAGIVGMAALLFVLPGVLSALPSSWSNPIEEFWPTNAGQQVSMMVRDSHTLTPWLGIGVMALFTAVVITVAFVLLQRRDA